MDRYICVHIDTATDKGKSLANAFELPGGLGIVISDQTGAVQAFRHEGDLDDTDLVRYLSRYADPDRAVRSTETNPVERTGYYYAPPPVYFAPSFSRGCST